MTIQEEIAQEFTSALKNKQTDKLSVLRLIKSALQNEEISKGSGLTDEDIIQVLRRQAKQRKESIMVFEENNRPESAQKEKDELTVISSFLPAEISDEKLELLVDAAIKETGAQDMSQIGKVMSYLMKDLRGQVDGSTLSKIASKKLSS